MANLFLLCEYATLNGGEQSMLSTLEGVAEGGFTPAVIAPGTGDLAEALRGRGIEVIPFRFQDAAGTRLPQEHLRKQLAEVLRRRRPDLLHANSLSMGRLSGPVVEELGVPSIAHLRDIIKISRKAMGDLNCHQRLLAVSEATKSYHVAQGMLAEKTHVLHNGVDLTRFQPRTPTGYLHRELGIGDAPLIGNIGQIGLRKGQDVLAKAAVTVAKSFPDAHYLFVGERFSEKEESRRFEENLRAAATGRLEGRLHFLGFRNDVERLLPELTLLVHAAHQEPLGRVLLEAAACGVAVVATDVGGTREIFSQGKLESARLVPAGVPDPMAEAIVDLLLDEDRRRDLGIAARNRAEAAFDIGRAVRGLVGHYRMIIDD